MPAVVVEDGPIVGCAGKEAQPYAQYERYPPAGDDALYRPDGEVDSVADYGRDNAGKKCGCGCHPPPEQAQGYRIDKGSVNHTYKNQHLQHRGDRKSTRLNSSHA